MLRLMALVLSLGVAIGLVVACMPQINGLLPSLGQAANSAAPIDTRMTTSTTQPPLPHRNLNASDSYTVAAIPF